MKRKSSLVLLSITILIAGLFGCKKDSTDNTPINGGVVFTSQLVFISTTNVTEEQYTATLGDVNVSVLKINDTVAVFQVPGSFAVGNTKLSIPDLNNLIVNYEVKMTVLANTPDIVLKELFDNIDVFLGGIGSGADDTYVQSVLSSLDEFYSTATAADKTKMAIYYQANKELFNGIINDDFTLQRMGSLGECTVTLLKFVVTSFPFAAGVAVAWLAPDPVEKLLAVVVASIGWRYTKLHYVEFTDCLMKAVNFVIDGISSSVNGRILNSYINYTDDIALSSSFSNIGRGVIAGDRGASAGVDKFFTTYDLVNSSISRLNTIITFVNDNVLFTDIDLVDPFVVAGSNTESEASVTEEVFNAMSFSVASSNVSIKSKSFSDGNINLTLKINDPAAVSGDYIDTELNYSYSDYFNSISGKFLIRVNKGGCDGPSTVTDIDGNVYNVVKIGNQCWMKENLKTTRYNDGSAIPTGLSNTAWEATTNGAYAIYDNNAANNTTYGKLYNWYAVNTGKLAPAGWHVPTDAEWTTLTTYLGGVRVAGGPMKATTLWASPNVGATNSSGFTGLPAGYRAAMVRSSTLGTQVTFGLLRRPIQTMQGAAI
ncbi:MAG: fibrobacter succinogenes major paralogous domain-containing protein [Sphingobacteriales bacterium]|nr:fibrobacter succinogenes major paralogous domain-containing protein [Sphingobacteriales bacterium]